MAPSRIKALILSLCFFFVFSCKGYNLEKSVFSIIRSDGTEVTVLAEIAVTDEEQMKGFMFRKHIPPGTGMLFLFPDDRIARFWMKNTPSPLSIAYIDYRGVIRDILDMTPLSEAEIVSSVNVRYALEVPQGWYVRNGIKPGDVIKDLPDYREEMLKKKK